MENNPLQADYLAHEQIYATNPTASGWNEVAVDQEVFSYVEELLYRARVTAPATILEVGCGMGNLAIPLGNAGFCVVGIDISTTAVERARQRALSSRLHASFSVGDVTLPTTYQGKSDVDCVLDGLCWHCIIGQDRQAFLRCVRNTLTPDGCFLVMTMCGNPRSSQLQAFFDPISRYITNGPIAQRYLGTPQDLEAELNKVGFKCTYRRLVAGNTVSGDQDMFLAVARKC